MTAERLIGLKSIAARLGVADEDTVTAWGALPWDPLPLRDWMGSVCAWPPFLGEWEARRADLESWRRALTAWQTSRPSEPTAAWLRLHPSPEPTLPIWTGWEDIAASIGPGVAVDTAQRAAELQRQPLPVLGHMLPVERLAREGGPPRVWIFRSALRDWIDSRDRPHFTGGTRGPRPDERQMTLFT